MRIAILLTAALLLLASLPACDDDELGNLTGHLQLHEQILECYEQPLMPLPGCTFTHGGGLRSKPRPTGFRSGGRGGQVPPAGPDRGTWRCSRNQAFLLDASSLDLQLLFRRVKLLDDESLPRQARDELAGLRTLNDPSFAKNSSALSTVCRAITEFYALPLSKLPVEKRHSQGVTGHECASDTLTITDRWWESNHIAITAYCSRETKRIFVNISYFKHWDGRTPAERLEFMRANGLIKD